jgi:AcrR family transcriptional regulator
MKKSQPKRPRGRPKLVDIDSSVEAAMLDYWSDGIHTRSINEICKRINLSKPAFYRAFEDEDGLMLATLKKYRELRIVPLLNLLEAKLPFDKVLTNAVEWLTEDSKTPKGCLFTKMRVLRTELGPKTLQEVQAMEMELLVALKALYLSAAEKNQVNKDISADVASLYIGSQLTMALVQIALEVPIPVIRSQVMMALGTLLNKSKA